MWFLSGLPNSEVGSFQVFGWKGNEGILLLSSLRAPLLPVRVKGLRWRNFPFQMERQTPSPPLSGDERILLDSVVVCDY